MKFKAIFVYFLAIWFSIGISYTFYSYFFKLQFGLSFIWLLFMILLPILNLAIIVLLDPGGSW